MPGLQVMTRLSPLSFSNVEKIIEYRLKNSFGSYRQLVYLKIPNGISIFSYSAVNDEIYQKYVYEYLNFVNSFVYWGDDPSVFIDDFKKK